jgi:hypothetical protein
MRTLLQLAATLLLTGAATAQVYSPENLIGHPPPPPKHQQATPTDDLQWLWQYTQPTPTGDHAALLADPRLQTLLRDNLHAPQTMWGAPGSPLPDAARAFLQGDGTVSSSDNRHLLLTGHTLIQPQQTGLLWIDLGDPTPLIVFAALRWNEQSNIPSQPGAPFTLWLFPSRELDAHHLPAALKSAIEPFAARTLCRPATIANAIVVEPTGVPFILGTAEAGALPGPCPKQLSNLSAPSSTLYRTPKDQ